MNQVDWHLIRKIYTNKSTIGELQVNCGIHDCHILEDTVRRVKQPGETAIPAGRYEIKLRGSKRYGRLMPYLIDVPYYTGIMIHWGNDDQDTRGCLLPGQTVMKDFVGFSRVAFDLLFMKIEEVVKYNHLFLNIIGGYRADEWDKRAQGVIS